MSPHSNVKQPNLIKAGILAGGHSRRFGRPKALLQLPDGVTMIEHVAVAARQVAGEVVLLGQARPLPNSLADLAVLPDERPSAGPLAGLCSLLGTVPPNGFGLLLACDMPNLNAQTLMRLIAAAKPDKAVVYECHDRRGAYHACCALYPASMLDNTRAALNTGILSLQALLSDSPKVVLQLAPQEIPCLLNINTPDDLKHFRAG